MGDVSKDSRQTENVLLPPTLRLFTQNTFSRLCVCVCVCLYVLNMCIYMADGQNPVFCVHNVVEERHGGGERSG